MTKVFLVDDEIVIREGIRSSFPWEKSEYTLVGEAPDGEIALPMIRDTNPDILITDIRMPFMDGMELWHALDRVSAQLAGERGTGNAVNACAEELRREAFSCGRSC